VANAWGLLGNDWAVNLLRGQIVQDRLSHAYLFTGPQGVGRRTLALRLAKAVNCEDAPARGDFCGKCRACSGFGQMGHPDLHIVQREEGDRDIKVGAVRELSRMLALTPYEANYQVALLIDFERASVQAANALLKTLEEPAQRVLLLLTAESGESLPATIASRCEALRLRPMPGKELAAGLAEQRGIGQDEAKLLARVSGGRAGYALRLSEDSEQMAQRGEWLEDFTQILSQSRVERFAYAQQLSKDKEGMRGALTVWLSFWRDLLLSGRKAPVPLTNLDREAEVHSMAGQLSEEAVRQGLKSMEETLDSLKGNVNTRLALENLFLKLPQVSAN